MTKASTSLLECAVYSSARKKLIDAMSLDIDRPINRAVVVRCAISATRNHLKLHISRTLKVLFCNTHAKTRVVEAFCRVAASRSNTRRSIHQPSIAALHAAAEMPTVLSSVPQYADIARRLVLASRLPSRAAPALNPHSARCTVGAQLSATSCLGAFWTPVS